MMWNLMKPMAHKRGIKPKRCERHSIGKYNEENRYW
jgi:hypothetical protein